MSYGVSGVIVSAVGDELVIAHPTGILPGTQVAAVVAGPSIYLLAHALFRLRMTGSLGRKRFFGALICLAAGGIGVFVPVLVLEGLLVAVLVAVISAEHLTAARRGTRGEPSPLELLEAPAAARDGEP